MQTDEVLELYEDQEALLKGHFLLASGYHSDRYLQSALVFQNPVYAEKLGYALARKIPERLRRRVNLVVSPALGGMLIGQEVARALRVNHIFMERGEKIHGQKKAPLKLRRGFKIQPGAGCLLVEDVVTTGGSTMEVAGEVTRAGGLVIGAQSIIQRVQHEIDGLPSIGCWFTSLVRLVAPLYDPHECPMCKEKIEFDKPDSS